MRLQRYRPILSTLRLISGLVLLFYTATHFLNHAVGVFGLSAIERGRSIFLGFWRNPAFYWIVPLSITIHGVLALIKLLTRKTYRGLTRREWLQIATGLLTPLFLMPHLYVTRLASMQLGVRDSYTFFLLTTYDMFPTMIVTLLLIWIHGNIGLYGYLIQKPWYRAIRRGVEAISLLLPMLAIAGILAVRSDIQRLFYDPLWLDAVLQRGNPRDVPLGELAGNFRDQFSAWYVGTIVAGILLRSGILWLQRRQNIIRIEYPGLTTIAIPRGTTLLEASLQHGIPHAHVCGGRGRCSTCRVRVTEGLGGLSRPSEAEARVLKRIGAPADVRLACQAIPAANCAIHPLLIPDATVQEGFQQTSIQQGSDKEIAILFADLRGFTSLTEHKLPYDTVFILNQYFQSMGQVIEGAGGYLDKFIGDGLMALFGLEETIAGGCRQALASAQAMARQLDVLNRQLQPDLSAPLQLGIGIHCGHVIVGEMGYKHTKHLTAIGDAVNIASRLEESTKEHNCQLIVSDEVVSHAAADFSAFPKANIDIRGRTQSLAVYSVASAKDYELPHP